MIKPNFYNDSNTVQKYFGGKVKHYPVSELVTVVGRYKYTLKLGENMYTLARDLFGLDKEFLWTVIAEINELREPDDWVAGETVYLPEIVVNETIEEETVFSDVKTDTTTVSITN